MFEIIPSILTSDPEELKTKLSLCEGVVERVQVDIVDGVFAQNKTIDPSFLDDIYTDLLLDFHLMTKEPINWVERCIRAGADRIIGQIEMMGDQEEFIGKVQSLGVKMGLAIDIDTPVMAIQKNLITDLDVVLVMSVKAGLGGQKFEDKALDKISTLAEIRLGDESPFKICDDGGITLDKIDDVRSKGADEVVLGKRLFEGDLRENIKKYQKFAFK